MIRTCCFPLRRSLFPAVLLSLLAMLASAPAGGQPTPQSQGIEGRWAVNFNGYTGTMDLVRSGNGWTGVLDLERDSNGVLFVGKVGPEALADISFDSRTGAVTFYRANGNQHYTGTLLGNSMSGLFDSQGTDGLHWSATRQGAAPQPTPQPTPQPPPQGAPRLSNGYAVDNCLHWGTDCGQPAADQYCKLTGHPAGASSFTTANMYPTWVIGDLDTHHSPNLLWVSTFFPGCRHQASEK